jgi:uncharacterized protein YyaL (SSP411 family)
MIAGFARASRVLPAIIGPDHRAAASHLETAERAASFLRSTMWDATRGVLLRRYRQGDAGIDAYAEDYAGVILGLLELFQAGGGARWLDWAIALQQAQDRLFWDADEGGWFSTTGEDPSVLLRMKEEYDGAEPSASGVGVWNLLTLAHLTGNASYEERARQVFAAFSERLTTLGRALPFMASALSTAHAPPEQIVVVGDAGAEDAEALWRAAHTRYRPFASILRVSPGSADPDVIAHLPWVTGMTTVNGAAAVYVCRHFACEAPTTDPDTLLG